MWFAIFSGDAGENTIAVLHFLTVSPGQIARRRLEHREYRVARHVGHASLVRFDVAAEYAARRIELRKRTGEG